MERLLYDANGRILHRNGTFVTDRNGAPCCGCTPGGGCNPAGLVFAPCTDPCTHYNCGAWAFTSSPGVFQTNTPAPVLTGTKCCNQFEDVANGWTRVRRQFFVNFSGQGDLYYVATRQENIDRYSGPPRTLYQEQTTQRTECRVSSGCQTVNGFTAQTTNPTSNPGPYCTIGLVNSWGTPCGPAVPGYTCASSGEYDCTTIGSRYASRTDSGTSLVAEGDTFAMRTHGACGNGTPCCCNGKCYDDVLSGCGPLAFPGYTCGTLPIVCQPRGRRTACCAYGGCLGDLSQDQCAALGGVFHNNRTCAQVPCGQQAGSCCYPNGSCQNTLEQQCVSSGGTWGGPGTNCNSTFCPTFPIGACCTPIGCVDGLTQGQCFAQGGTGWFQGQACAQNPCGGGTGPGACCSLGGGGRPLCTIEQNRAACEALNGGVWLGSGTSCTPDPCGTVATNPFTAAGPARFISIPRPGLIVPSGGCAGCGGAKVVPL